MRTRGDTALSAISAPVCDAEFQPADSLPVSIKRNHHDGAAGIGQHLAAQAESALG